MHVLAGLGTGRRSRREAGRDAQSFLFRSQDGSPARRRSQAPRGEVGAHPPTRSNPREQVRFRNQIEQCLGRAPEPPWVLSKRRSGSPFEGGAPGSGLLVRPYRVRKHVAHSAPPTRMRSTRGEQWPAPSASPLRRMGTPAYEVCFTITSYARDSPYLLKTISLGLSAILNRNEVCAPSTRMGNLYSFPPFAVTVTGMTAVK